MRVECDETCRAVADHRIIGLGRCHPCRDPDILRAELGRHIDPRFGRRDRLRADRCIGGGDIAIIDQEGQQGYPRPIEPFAQAREVGVIGLRQVEVAEVEVGEALLAHRVRQVEEIEVTLAEGRSPEQLRTLMSTLTYAAVDALGAPLESIRVVLREVPTTHWAAGDVTIAERRATGTPELPSP